jgi:hypothetical protein
VHYPTFTEWNSHQISHLHLTQAKRCVAPLYFPADLYYASGLAYSTVPNHTGSQVGFGQDLFQYNFHLFDIHWIATSLNRFGIINESEAGFKQ